MTDTRFLVHGVSWDGPASRTPEYDGGTPALRVQSPAGGLSSVSLEPGSRLGFRPVVRGRFCLGHHKVFSASSREHVLCPGNSQAVKGKQCERCFAMDDSRLIHDFHRGGQVPDGLRSYLMQEHWLYVATFANGTSKVGTASNLRKWNRLAEQGAVVARYVVRARDGGVVRVLEDLVTQEAGLTQQVRSAAKADALTAPRPDGELDSINRRHASTVRALLGQTAVVDFELVDESWVRPAQAAMLCGAGERHAYPQPLDAGQHGLRIAALCGANALATLDGSDARFVVNLGQLAGSVIQLGDFTSEVPAVQEPLF